MDTHIPWEGLVGVMGDPTQWVARLHAEVKNEGDDPNTLSAAESFPVTSVTYDAQAERLTIAIGDRTLAYRRKTWMKIVSEGYGVPTKEPIRIQFMHDPAPDFTGGSCNYVGPMLCLELTHKEREQAEQDRQAEERRLAQERQAVKDAESAAHRAAQVRKMAAKVVPPLEERLVGKRIASVGVGHGALMISCEDGTELVVSVHYGSRTITCGDIEINHLEANMSPATEVRQRSR